MDDTEDIRKAFGKRVTALRKIKGMTRRELGLAIGSTAASATAIMGVAERGVHFPRVDTLIRIARALGVTPGFLLDGGEFHSATKVTL
jgi:transcriptional regulator with XRE-family HTH domain